MLSNKEKRLSQAHEVYPYLESPFSNHLHPSAYGKINPNSPAPINGAKNDPQLKRLMNDRNSHSLSHEFSQIYTSNMKHKLANFTQAKKADSGKCVATLEEMNLYKKETLEAKKQLFQMEKSINYWNDCTEYWRNKWRKERADHNKSKAEVKSLKSRLVKLEHQLELSESKRSNLSQEVNLLTEQLSRLVYRFEDENNNNNNGNRQKTRKAQLSSERRTDSRRRKNETAKLRKATVSSSSDELEQRVAEMKLDDEVNTRFPVSNPKILYRNHERLFDKKIMNRKRFSQVVMLDEDEIFELNQELPTPIANSNKSFDNSTLKNNDDEKEGENFHNRFIDYVLEEDSNGEEEEEEDAAQNDQVNSNLSTMATNSECANVGSFRQNENDDDDDDSLKFVVNTTTEEAAADYEAEDDDEV